MFASATLKLTAWYLAILMAISLVFSVAIYQIASSEFNLRLEGLQTALETGSGQYDLEFNQNFLDLRQSAARQAAASLFIGLLYANIAVLLAGGIGAFWLANRTLRPIKHIHEAQSRFVSDASHELRTPLAIMQTELEVALNQPSLSKADYREILDSNLEEVIKLSRLSTTLLQLSRIEQADRKNIEMANFDFAELVKTVTKRHDRSGKRLVLDSPNTPLMIHGNNVTIEELITILVDNALKYSPGGSEIKLKLSQRRHNAVFTITNLGDGISPNVLPHIFERFYRVDKSRSKSGSGLGLSLAKKIVDLHDGDLSVKSGVGRPTKFTVSLALANKKS